MANQHNTPETGTIQPKSNLQPETVAQKLSIVVEIGNQHEPKSTLAALSGLAKQLALPVEFILVESNGKGSEWQQATANHPNCIVLTQTNALQSGEALRLGVERASGTHVLTVDRFAVAPADEVVQWLQTSNLPQEQIWVGSRSELKASFFQRLGWGLWNFIVHFFTSLQVRDTQAGIYLFPANIAKGLFAISKAKSIHYRSDILYKAHLQDIRLEEKAVSKADQNHWNSIKQLVSYKWQVFTLAWGTWFRHYFVHPFQKNSLLPQQESPLYRFGFAITALLLLVLMPILSGDYGMTGDEHVQRVYGEYVLDYYETNGDDDRALSYKDLYNYGGLFDYWAAWFNRYIYGGEADGNMYGGRHLLNAFAGWFLFFFIGLLAKLVTGRWSVALWALLFAIFSPRLFGDSMNNPKDIPFAAAYIFTIFHILRFVQQLPRPQLKNMFWIAVGIAAAINIRIGGLLLIAYFGLFVGLAFLLRADLRRRIFHLPTLLDIALMGVFTSLLGFWWGTAYWPYAALDPFQTPFTVLDKMSDYYVGIRILFNGESIWSDTVPWNYIPVWLLYTSPLFILAGLAIFPVMLGLRWKKSPVLPLFLLSFAGIFPIAYVIYLQSGLYDGMRHTLFAYSTFPILAAWAWMQIGGLLGDKKAVQIGLSVVLAGLVALPGLFMVRNHPYQYVYFNELAGGVPGAQSNFDVDYWMTSMRELSEWLVDNEPRIAKGDTLFVATNCYEPVAYYFKYQEYTAKRQTGYTKPYRDFLDNYAQDKIWNTTVIYTRYHERERHRWDFGIFYPRFIDKEFLSSGTFPPDKVIHAAEVDGVPIGVVIQRPSQDGPTAYKAFAAKDFETSVRLYEGLVAREPKNESAWLFLMQSYANKGDMPNMKRCVDKLFTLSDRYGTGYGWLGTYYLNVNQLDSAQHAFEQAIEYDYKYTLPYFQLARILSQPGRENPKKALDYLEKFDEYGGKPQEGYDLAIQIATKANDKVRLQYFSAKKAGLTNFNAAYEQLKACLQLDRNYQPAVKAKKLYDELLNKQKAQLAGYKKSAQKAQKAKDQVRYNYFMGKQMQMEGRAKEAYDAFKKSSELDPNYRPAQIARKELGKELKLE